MCQSHLLAGIIPLAVTHEKFGDGQPCLHAIGIGRIQGASKALHGGIVVTECQQRIAGIKQDCGRVVVFLFRCLNVTHGFVAPMQIRVIVRHLRINLRPVFQLKPHHVIQSCDGLRIVTLVIQRIGQRHM